MSFKRMRNQLNNFRLRGGEAELISNRPGSGQQIKLAYHKRSLSIALAGLANGDSAESEVISNPSGYFVKGTASLRVGIGACNVPNARVRVEVLRSDDGETWPSAGSSGNFTYILSCAPYSIHVYTIDVSVRGLLPRYFKFVVTNSTDAPFPETINDFSLTFVGHTTYIDTTPDGEYYWLAQHGGRLKTGGAAGLSAAFYKVVPPRRRLRLTGRADLPIQWVQTGGRVRLGGAAAAVMV